MSDDPDSPPEREMKDFQFRQMKKTRVFESPEDLPKERSNLLALSNKFGLTFVGQDRMLKVFLTRDILAADKADGNSNKIVEGIAALVEVVVESPLHHLALSSDDLTLSVCGTAEESGLSLAFYDVRTFINKARPQKLPFASLRPAVDPGTCVQDLKWNPGLASILAACLSDGSMMVLEITDSVMVQAQLPAAEGITCICWSPKGKQVAAGKMNATVSQYTPALQEKKVIPCPSFYSSDNPVKVLDVLWLSTFVFAVAYAAADGSPETPPELVVVSQPKKEERRDERYLNFNDPVYGTCTERQHHYFLCHVEDWDVVLAASAASIEVSVIAKQEDKTNWELWLLEDASRGELPVSKTNDDTLPLGMAIDYTSQQEVRISEEKTLPPVPVLLMLSTDGVLCPFALLNINPGAKQLVAAPAPLALEGERAPPAGSAPPPPLYKPSLAAPPAAMAFPALRPPSAATPTPPPPAASSVPPPFPTAAPAASSGFSFSLPPTSSAPPTFSLGGSAMTFGAAGFSFASKPPSDTPSAASAFSFSAPSVKPPAEAAPSPAPVAPAPQRLATASPITVLRGPPEPATPSVKLNLNDRFSAVETPAPASQSFSFAPTPKPAFSEPPPHAVTKAPAMPAPVRPVQTSTPPVGVQRPAPATQTSAPTPQMAVLTVKAMEKQLQQRKDTDPVMAGILEEIAHFQKELDDLKARSNKADFRVGANEEMRELRKESEDLHVFTLEIKETTESLHGDISTLKTTMLEGFAGAEDGRAQSELNTDRGYLQLLYKKSLDPRSEDQLKEIRRLYQYVKLAVEDVNDVLDVEWEKHLEKKKKQKHMMVPEREALFTALSNNLDIINQQKQRLDRLVKELHALRLYNKTAAWSTPPPRLHKPAPATHTSATTPTSTEQGLDSELESLREALLKASLETAPQASSKSPAKMSPIKQSQLRNFLSKRHTPPVRSTAPANLSRSAFLSPKYYEDLDDLSSTSSFSQALDPDHAHLELDEEEEELEPGPAPLPAPPPAASSSSSLPCHPMVVRTPSIQPGFGGVQSTPFSKVQPPGLGLGLSPIPSPVPTNKISMGGADSTALATKTVKHGAPPTEKATPVTNPAQQAAATAALRRQMANQKPAGSASLTESTLKNVPQVVNVQDFKDKGPPLPVCTAMSPSVPAPAVQVVQQVLATVETTNQAKRQGVLKMSEGPASSSQSSFVFGGAPRAEAPVVPGPGLGEQRSKAFSFSPATAGSFSFSSVAQGAGSSQVKDVSRFSFGGGSGKMLLVQAAPGVDEAPFSFAPAKSASSASSALGGAGSPLPPEPTRPPSSSSSSSSPPGVPRAGGETLGSFSGLRVGQGDEEGRSSSAFSFGQADHGAGAAQFSFAPASLSPPDPAAPDLSKPAAPGSAGGVFKPPEPAAAAKPAFSATSFSRLLAAPLPSPEEEPKAAAPPPSPTPPPAPSPVPSDPERASSPIAPESLAAGDAPPAADPSPSSVPEKAPTPPPASAPPPAPPAPSASPPAAPTPHAASPEPVQESPAPEALPASPPPTLDSAQPAAASSEPGSIFTQSPPPPPAVDSSTAGVAGLAPVITTATTTPTTDSAVPAPVFGQPAPPSASSAPAPAPPATGFGAPGFGAGLGGGGAFGSQPMFGQGGGFGQPASNAGGGFGFGQSAFGAPAAAAGGGGLFGASSASSFSFGPPSSSSTASSTGAGLFGQSATPAFGQQSAGFGQGSVFGSNTTTTASTGFSFPQTSAFGGSAPSVFGQQPSGGSVFGQQQSSSGGGLFGAGSGNAPGASAGGGFFSGLGGKPSEDAANKNPFGAPASTGGFGQPSQPGSTSLFGNSGAKTFGFGQPSSFGEQKASGTFSTGGGSVAAQGFGSFATPAKTAGFGSAPVFGSPPAFGGSPAFGGAAAFGSAAPSFSSPMGSTASKVFGEGTAAANVGGFGFASPQSGPTFGSLASQSAAPSFGALAQQQPAGFSGFGQAGGGAFSGGFGSSNQLTPRWPGLQ